VGSGIMGERLAGGSLGLALLANSMATGAMLVALILAFGPLSGAHLNPAVSLVVAARRGLAWSDVPSYVVAQLTGAIAGVAVADLMFDLPAFSFSQHARHGWGQLLGEGVATFGLVSVVLGCSTARPRGTVAVAVGAYITAAYWFTASTSFANPAVTIARSLTDSFAGIRPADVPAFLVVQMAGAAWATLLFCWLAPGPRALPTEAPPSGVEPATRRRAS
jgi:glycerol uptake facilitator-like aquaporin